MKESKNSYKLVMNSPLYTKESDLYLVNWKEIKEGIIQFINESKELHTHKQVPVHVMIFRAIKGKYKEMMHLNFE
ncbi:hypothetical protein AAG747_25960 [Rapidithrix thailandica]|uniref:Uncharacterized protein n=1 Tax=Rapidithrix thailandica TaxID=413964 RepID=A0AAW9SJN9_9BACT